MASATAAPSVAAAAAAPAVAAAAITDWLQSRPEWAQQGDCNFPLVRATALVLFHWAQHLPHVRDAFEPMLLARAALFLAAKMEEAHRQLPSSVVLALPPRLDEASMRQPLFDAERALVLDVLARHNAWNIVHPYSLLLQRQAEVGREAQTLAVALVNDLYEHAEVVEHNPYDLARAAAQVAREYLGEATRVVNDDDASLAFVRRVVVHRQ